MTNKLSDWISNLWPVSGTPIKHQQPRTQFAAVGKCDHRGFVRTSTISWICPHCGHKRVYALRK